MNNLVPVTVADALAVATQLAQSGMVPRDYAGKPGAIYAAIDLGASVGLRPMQAVQGIASINGRPALWGDAALGVVMAHPNFESIDEDAPDVALKNGAGRCRVVRKGCPPYEVKFTVDAAKAAGLWGKAGPWSQYPGRMLQMRARSWAFRDRFPDALKGIGIAEEVRDAPPTIEADVVDMMPRSTDDAPPPPVVEVVAEPAAPNPGEVAVNVVAVDVAKGTNAKSGAPWTRYGVKTDSGDTFGTFSDTIGGQAQALVGKAAFVLVESRRVGDKDYYDLKAIRPC